MATRRALPLSQWLALEDDVARHKAEIAKGFAEARARLLPEPPERQKPSMADFWRGMLNAEQQRNLAMLQAQTPYYGNPFISRDPAGADLWTSLTGFRRPW